MSIIIDNMSSSGTNPTAVKMISSTTQLLAIKPHRSSRGRKAIEAATSSVLLNKITPIHQLTHLQKNDETEETAESDLEEEEEELSCVICIGSTGAGKSATISKCTKRPVSSGNGRDRVTVRCAKYDLRTDAKEDLEALRIDKDVIDLNWVDTVGWDDADLQDDSTFKDILQFICDHQLLRVKAIIWNILPNCRRDALLTKQARLINLFKPKDIWHNVLIVCKQSRNPEDDAQGALAAARQFNRKAEPAVLGFTYIDDGSLTLNQRRRFESAPSLREDFLIKTDDEVCHDIFKKISDLKDPILVVFKNQKCLDCGLTGDVRLMSNYCHMEKVFVHPGSLIQYHPKRTERYHDSTTVIREHPGGLYRPWYSLDFFICKMGGERYLCCGSLGGQPGCRSIRSCCKKVFVDGDDPVTGCQERYQCCKIDVTSKVQGCKSKFDCCDGKVKSRGCEELCKKCDRAWGTPAEGCYEKEHNIIDTTPNLKPQPEKKRNLLA